MLPKLSSPHLPKLSSRQIVIPGVLALETHWLCRPQRYDRGLSFEIACGGKVS